MQNDTFGCFMPEEQYNSPCQMNPDCFETFVTKQGQNISENQRSTLEQQRSEKTDRNDEDYLQSNSILTGSLQTRSQNQRIRSQSLLDNELSSQANEEKMSAADTSKQLGYLSEISSQPQGLPNVGNTCHLNSLLQFLFSASKYRRIMLSIRRKSTEKCTISLIIQLFTILQKKNQNQEKISTAKREILNQFVMNLEKMNLTYIRYQQEDVFETLNNLINNLDYKDWERNKITELFSILTSKKCPCLDKPMEFESIYYTKGQKCQACKQEFQQINLNAPQYLIRTDFRIEEEIEFVEGKGQNEKRHTYQFVSSIIYSGTGRFGHYTCIKKNHDKLFEISDNTVSEKKYEDLSSYSFNSNDEHSSTYFRKPIATLYQKISEKKERKKKRVLQHKKNKGTFNDGYYNLSKNFIKNWGPLILIEAATAGLIIYLSWKKT